ncbi:Ubinuclein-1-like protein [Drosera capensis]
MPEDKGGGGVALGGGGDSSSSKPSSSFERSGDRIWFTVELVPGETTIVSWKRFMKDTSKAEKGGTVVAGTAGGEKVVVDGGDRGGVVAGQPKAEEIKDAAAPNRFSAVIEKIERLYKGKDSSDEEDLGDIPDDDQYDTEDSFIDDAELDAYFEVDKAKTKHDGFFVNRGKLESISEPSQQSVQQPKKRRRKEAGKDPLTGDDRPAPNKLMKLTKKTALKAPSVRNPSQTSGVKEANHAEMKSQSDAHAKQLDRGAYGQVKHQSGKSNNFDMLELSSPQKERNLNREQIDLNLAVGQHSVQSVRRLPSTLCLYLKEAISIMLTHLEQFKHSLSHKKEGSVVRAKGNSLEKAFRELEKMVADSRPPTSDVQDADASSQAIKRRLPREIKLKLAKVARLSQSSRGKVPEDLLRRLMSILGHLMQLRTLKRHLRVMVNTSLSADQEKDDKFQQIKREVVEMIKMRAPSAMSKAIEQQLGGTEDHQDESGIDGKGSLEGHYSMDVAMEDKMCDLYDIFIDRFDEDATPQVRKLYSELAELWPKGAMNNHGIKRAICRAKERRKEHDRNKEQENIKRRKKLALKAEENARVEHSSGAQPSHPQERSKSPTDSSPHVATSSHNRLSSSASATTTSSITATLALAAPNHSQNAPYSERAKQGNAKGVTSAPQHDIRLPDIVPPKKVKRKPESETGASVPRPEKVSSLQTDDKKKSNKHSATLPVAGVPEQSNFTSAAVSRFE